MRLSYSALETFRTCPLQFKLQFIDKIKVPKSKEAIFGSIIHETLRMFHEPAHPYPLSEDDLLKYFTQKWDPSVYEDRREEAFAFHEGIQILKNYYAQNKGKQLNIVSLETPFDAPILYKGELHQITGIIDRIDKLPDGNFEIIDYKTSRKMPAQKSVDEHLQLSVYHLGIVNRWPSLEKENRPVKLTLYFLKHGEQLSTIKTAEQLNETKLKILDIIEQIKKSDFKPKPNPLCDWCSYQQYCPLFKHKFIKPSINEEKINNVIKEFFEIKSRQEKDAKRMAELRDIINRYFNEHKIERIFGEEGYITRLFQKRFGYDINKIKEILAPLGKWEEVLTIDQSKLNKIMNSLPYEIRRKIEESKKIEREFITITGTKSKDVNKDVRGKKLDVSSDKLNKGKNNKTSNI